MKPTILTLNTKPPTSAAVRRPSRKAAEHMSCYVPKRRDENTVFAWTIIGFTSTLLMAGTAFFAYVFTHLP